MAKVRELFDFVLELLFRHEIRRAEAVAHGTVSLVDYSLAEGFLHALRHGIIKAVNGLAAEHVVLVALNGYAGQAGISADGIRLPQEAVPRGEATVKKL